MLQRVSVEHLCQQIGNGLPFAALALEWKEVELMAEGHVAVSANSFDVGSGHFGITVLFGRRIRSR